MTSGHYVNIQSFREAFYSVANNAGKVDRTYELLGFIYLFFFFLLAQQQDYLYFGYRENILLLAMGC